MDDPFSFLGTGFSCVIQESLAKYGLFFFIFLPIVSHLNTEIISII